MAEKTLINDFVQHFTTDFARSNLFQVSFDGVQLKTPEATEHLMMSCKNIQVPGITFIEGKYMFNGFNRKSAIGADLDPINLTFLVDGSGKTLEIFEEWSNKIFDKQTGKFGFKEDYQTNINIMLLDRTGNVYDNIKIFDAYPTNIDSVDVSWDSSDTIMELSVAFNFERMISTFNGAAPAELKPLTSLESLASSLPLPNIQIPSFPDVVNKIPLDIKVPTSLKDIANKIPIDIKTPEPLNDVKNKIDDIKSITNKAESLFKF